MKLYLAGPMRGHDNFNFPAFWDAARVLRERGHEIVSPAEIDVEEGYCVVRCVADEHPRMEFYSPHKVDWEAYGCVPSVEFTNSYLADRDANLRRVFMRDFEEISKVDGIVFLPGWETSTGANAELAFAKALGLSLYDYWPKNVDGLINRLDYEEPKSWKIEPDSVEKREESRRRYETVAERRLRFSQPSLPSSEIRVVDPDTGGAKGSKLARFDLIPPDFEWALAEHYGRGSLKYEDRNWQKGYRWSLSIASLRRHLAEWLKGVDLDEDGNEHLIAVAWHAIALWWFQHHAKGTDDRYLAA